MGAASKTPGDVGGFVVSQDGEIRPLLGQLATANAGVVDVAAATAAAAPGEYRSAILIGVLPLRLLSSPSLAASNDRLAAFGALLILISLRIRYLRAFLMMSFLYGVINDMVS